MAITSLTAAPAAWAAPAAAPTVLRVFVGGGNQRPDLMRQLFARYMASHPGLRIDSEAGGSTSDLQRQYLSTVLNAKDPSLDIFLVDIVNPAQYEGAGWIEPLNAYLGPPSTVMRRYLPAYGEADVVQGRIAALPAFADAMFMYYRRDLLEKYHLPPPRTWDELGREARLIQAGEHQPRLQGLSIQGAPIEGTVCTFLLPYWSAGKALTDADGRLTLDRDTAARGLQQWLDLMASGVIKRNVAEVKTQDTVDEFKAGRVVFGIGWSFAWDRFARDADSQVRGRVGVMALPAVTGGRRVSCLGGWQWAVSAYSRHKAEAAALVHYLASAEAAKYLAIHGALLPTDPALYHDAEVLHALPWLADASEGVLAGRSRPATPDYAQVSDAISSTTSAVLAGVKTPAQGVRQIGSRLARVLR
ncbi:MAG: ABC transporter substrate-binding protein [Burkholderiales bacterium]|nr:ABC transporter substrate-binding protein [Burkholderiales bacterium]